MSVKELLTKAYNTRAVCKINLNLSENITLDDIFVIAYLDQIGCTPRLSKGLKNMINTACVTIDEDDIPHPLIQISSKIKNPHIIAMLYIIINDINHAKICVDSNELKYEDAKPFIELAKFTSVINFSSIRNIMTLFGIFYFPEINQAEFFVRAHLGIN